MPTQREHATNPQGATGSSPWPGGIVPDRTGKREYPSRSFVLSRAGSTRNDQSRRFSQKGKACSTESFSPC